MKKSSLLFLALAGSLFIYSCEKKGENQQAAQDTTKTSMMEEKKGLSDDDKEFISKAAEDGMLEVKLGELASQKATSKDVKKLGEMLSSQHQMANDELKQLASTKNVPVADSLNDNGKSKMDKFQDKKLKTFDQDFVKEIIEDHKKDINKFEETAQKTQDPELKAWIDKTLPHLKHHLGEAQKIDSTLNTKTMKKSSAKK